VKPRQPRRRQNSSHNPALTGIWSYDHFSTSYYSRRQSGETAGQYCMQVDAISDVAMFLAYQAIVSRLCPCEGIFEQARRSPNATSVTATRAVGGGRNGFAE